MNLISTTIVNILSPAPRDAWEEAFQHDPLALETQSPDWMDAMCATSGFENASRLYEMADGHRLILPLLRRSFAGGAVAFEAANPLHCGVGGLLAPENASPRDLVAIFDDLAQRSVLSQSIWPHPLQEPLWAQAAPEHAIIIPHRAHLLDLADGWEEIWSKHFQSTRRTGVRRAERRGITVECGTAGQLVPEFYHLLELAAIRWARIQHEPYWLALRRLRYRDPLAKFEAIGKLLKERCHIWLARVEDRPAAAIVVLQGTNAYYYRGAMDEELMQYPTNDLLQYHAIKDASLAGCHYYYMGDSGWSVSLAQFKERFGARAYTYSEYRLERLPLSRIEQKAKKIIKRLLRFKDF